ncbi:DUF4982 domain-containing protein [Georgenia sp. TF02-10]|uniref:glycoside hydrolase family 2 TIM barrel-domain containing protein n=1 Tax=Georgenia sp. TF02-10 TaxID=2917725 RepID=UPI001FA7C035|nr:glycoside hydrolase family 2 TIM barrel-domain containing protein [Georgenia sp. TF02-10]UNX54644.1 DUF4982 domain-containing protein [Georgenia sp. TF02-10]
MHRIRFTDDWYVATETPGRERPASGPVRLPHDAMLLEPRDPDCANGANTGYYPGGIYRYTKRFDAPGDWRGQVVLAEFEGVYQRSRVTLNGVPVGRRPSGYAEFRVPLTEALRFDEENVLEVLVDNSQEPNSRWYTGSGIYRPVHLLVGPPVHVAPSWPRISTVSADASSATVEVRTVVANDGAVDRDVVVSAVLTGPAGNQVPAEGVGVTVPAGASVTVMQTVTIPDPARWSPETPALYDAEVTVAAGDGSADTGDGTADTGDAGTDARDAAADAGHPGADVATARFGIRTLAVDARQGLRVNGRPVKLRGAAVHHDHGVIGAHTLPAAEHRRVRLLKEAGFNAIRSAHNPASRALLDACDELGMLVMDELTDVWTRPKTNWDYSLDFPQWWERDLESMIEKDAHHPCVVMYSIGNEIGETATAQGVALGGRMAARTRELDPTRPVVSCINAFLNLAAASDEAKVQRKAAKARAAGRQEANKNLVLLLNLFMAVMSKAMKLVLTKPIVDKKTRDAYAAVDIAGYNYMAARFRTDHRLHPDRVMVGSEDPATQTVAIWHDIADQPHVIGDFVWTGWDYLGEGALAAARYNDRPRLYLPYPALAAGTPNIDITGVRQTQSFLNEIAWGLRTDPYLAVRPVNHAGDTLVASSWRSTDSIRSWSWEGHEGRTAVVEVYGPRGEVELRLDGATVGRAAVGPETGHLATFEVPYAPGELTAVLSSDGAEIGRDTLRSAGTTSLRLTLLAEEHALRADGDDLAHVHIELTDADGVLRPLADRPVTLRVDGAAQLLGFGTGEPITTEGFDSPTRTTYYGRALAVLRAGREPGRVTVTATADGCDPGRVELAVE